jgi:hypothetical protein
VFIVTLKHVESSAHDLTYAAGVALHLLRDNQRRSSAKEVAG